MNYFDYAATCPLDRDAAEIYIRASTEFYGNSQSLHDVGSAASNLLESCRDEISGLLGVDRSGVFFYGGRIRSEFSWDYGPAFCGSKAR